MTRKLDVFQSMWAMEQRCPDGREHTPEARDEWMKAIKDSDLDTERAGA